MSFTAPSELGGQDCRSVFFPLASKVRRALRGPSIPQTCKSLPLRKICFRSCFPGTRMALCWLASLSLLIHSGLTCMASLPARQEYGLGLGHNNQGFHEGERGTNNHARTRGVYWDFPSKQREARSVGINHMATRISAWSSNWVTSKFFLKKIYFLPKDTTGMQYTECLCPPKFICWNFNPQGDDTGRWGLWELIKSWGWSPRMGLVLLGEETEELASSLSLPSEDRGGSGHLQTGKWALTRNWTARHLDLRLPAYEK